ncbi:unnamed protein product [Pieris macdunnoughi]|uniref:Uncharacterized protein n=1 Tax=Pieris macdunnoughi TaxID=345717 RepID=A0A821R535_9NEOP|nr:unnamed protein product [Pieris macdunnoughi]
MRSPQGHEQWLSRSECIAADAWLNPHFVELCGVPHRSSRKTSRGPHAWSTRLIIRPQSDLKHRSPTGPAVQPCNWVLTFNKLPIR